MTMGLVDISLGPSTDTHAPLQSLEETHGVTDQAARMYERFFGQNGLCRHADSHSDMLLDSLRLLVEAWPDLAHSKGLGVYAKTQTHNTPVERDWLRLTFDKAGLDRWEVLTGSMTNCATGLAAVHLFATETRPVIILAGEKAFHRTGSRLPAGLLGEAPVAALFSLNGTRKIRRTHTRHLPRFHLNPDDMANVDRQALQSSFESELTRFLANIEADDPIWFGSNPTIVPYNLNRPLLLSVLNSLGWTDRLLRNCPAEFGHTFCSDVFLNLARVPPAPDRPLLLFVAGMGVTFSAIQFDPLEKEK